MKKFLLLIMLTFTLQSADSPYIGAGPSVTEKDEGGSCRASSSFIGGVKFSQADFTFSIEGRHINSLNGSISDNVFLVKPEYKGAYALAGYGKSNYTEQDLEFTGMRYGAGYDFGSDWKHLFIDVVYDEKADDYRLTTGFIYYFESGF